jgi:ADP-dependent NAD(P)H-hydrate dehydratase / NAD(P)H-hydrate epimerase
LLEKFLAKSRLPMTLTKDAIDYVTSSPQTALNRQDTLLVLSLSQLQRLATAAKAPKAIAFSMDLLHMVEWLHEFTLAHRPYIIVKHLEHLFVAADGQVSTTRLSVDKPVWRVKISARAAVWWLQHAKRPFEAITTALVLN